MAKSAHRSKITRRGVEHAGSPYQNHASNALARQSSPNLPPPQPPGIIPHRVWKYQVLADATWQRCRVHFMRNLLARIPQADKSVVAALVRTVFAQPNQQAARQQLAEIARGMQPRWPDAADLLRAAEDEVLAYMTFPAEHWTRLYSTNVLERLNREVKRRTDVVQVFPTDGAVLRLAGAILLEIADEWTVERHYFSQSSMQRLNSTILEPTQAGPRLAPVR